jgi:hypothetical protein
MGSGIEHVPFVSQHPAQRRKLAVDHAPLEVIPRAVVIFAELAFCPFCRLERTLPDRIDGMGLSISLEPFPVRCPSAITQKRP